MGRWELGPIDPDGLNNVGVGVDIGQPDNRRDDNASQQVEKRGADSVDRCCSQHFEAEEDAGNCDQREGRNRKKRWGMAAKVIVAGKHNCEVDADAD
ncbi:hypothetical protein D9M69_643960 [compost metagenome]